jgi:DMSO reductase anchor subunit
VNPAYSIIFFSTASGAGYGLLALLALDALASGASRPPGVALSGLALAALLVTAGLISSTLHLGHPERAWRALSQWRSSWLSREGVLALTCYPPGLAWTWQAWRGVDSVSPWLPPVCGALALATVFATSMIYASLRTVDAWHRPSVPVNYLLLALASGAVLRLALLHWHGDAGTGDALLAASLVTLAALAKWRYWAGLAAQRQPSTGHATGLDALGAVSSLAWPHTARNYLQKEMGYELARRHAARLRRIAWLTAFATPLACALASAALDGTVGGTVATLALPVMALGLLVERWLFFAEARHTVSAFYGRPPPA